MISFNQAQLILQQQKRNLGIETLPLSQVNGRILAETIHAPIDLPSFRNSAMDGFALNSQWVNAQSQNEFNVEQVISAGEVELNKYNVKSACAVMTGAYVPNCYDTVIPIEQVCVKKSGKRKTIVVSKPIEALKHIREAGEDVKAGEQIVALGKKIGAREQALCMALGIQETCVFKKPRVALLTTGNEVLDVVQKKLPLGLIYNSNAVYLKNKLLEFGVEVDYFGIVQDNPVVFKSLLLKIMRNEYDCIISTGAVSAGDYDFIPSVLKELKADILFHKVRMRPGKPILLGKLPSNQLIFSLPGNPVSAVVGLEFFVLPWLRQMMQCGPMASILTCLTTEAQGKLGFTCFKKAYVDFNQQQLRCSLLSGQFSFQIKSLLSANAWVKLSADNPFYAPGALVETYYQQ